MKEAIRQAKKAEALEEVPIGCVIVHEGKIINVDITEETQTCAVVVVSWMTEQVTPWPSWPNGPKLRVSPRPRSSSSATHWAG